MWRRQNYLFLTLCLSRSYIFHCLSYLQSLPLFLLKSFSSPVSLVYLITAPINCQVMMAYPMGLPAWDPVALCIAGEEGESGWLSCIL